ncbi:MAG: zinc finger-like domain-containing protein [Acidobacteria bacterium]|nr:zinc finger-like domain-containing protein [Acidobacteriota bacterium]
MNYRITVYEPQPERRDHPDLLSQTQRTVCRLESKPGALAKIRKTAIALLETHAEVTIWKENRNIGHLVQNWVPAGTPIMLNPRWLETDRQARSDRTRLPVTRYAYEYEGGGVKRRLMFETHDGEGPQVPMFGTRDALTLFKYQWECWDCHGTGSVDYLSGNRQTCDTCGGSGQRTAPGAPQAEEAK